MNPEGTTALITGSARVGAEVAATLAARGCRVALGWRSSREAAEAAVASIRAAGGVAEAVQGDLNVSGGAEGLVARAAALWDGLHILVHLASSYERVDFDKLDEAAWDRAMGADLRGAYLASLAAARWMRRAGEGRIVTVADWTAASGRPRYPGYLPYYSAKAGLIGLTEALALELAPTILVNAIAPGPILPPPGMDAEEIAAVERATPLGRWGGPAEIAKAALFLVESDFVTGECLRVDGGRHLK